MTVLYLQRGTDFSVRLLTNDHVVSDVMSKVKNITEEQRRKYGVTSITANLSI
jgi:hypothetical protein